ncbi:MAG: hypothetical protein LBG98_02190, partial [Puniceicoccales bacterium]|nr:hypothetical protein [Puniceicoccales bacterium]
MDHLNKKHLIQEIAFFSTQEYDRISFDARNKNYGYKITYHTQRLSESSIDLIGKANILCAFVNDDLSANVIKGLTEHGVELLAMRCA